MVWFEKYRWIFYGAALLVLTAGVFVWITAGFSEPGPIKQTARNPVVFHNTASDFPMERYQKLTSGALFYGVDAVAATAPVFTTRLTVLGITRGRTNWAVVGTGDSKQTWIIKAGDKVNGERIAAVGNDFVEIRNDTGTGRIHLEN